MSNPGDALQKAHPSLEGDDAVGVLTADNPKYKSAGKHADLEQDIASLGLKTEQTLGNNKGSPHRSLLVHGITRDQLATLGKKYGQEAVTFSQGGKHELHYTNGPKDGHFHPSTDTAGKDSLVTLPTSAGHTTKTFDFSRLIPRGLASQSNTSIAGAKMAKSEQLIAEQIEMLKVELKSMRAAEMRKSLGGVVAPDSGPSAQVRGAPGAVPSPTAGVQSAPCPMCGLPDEPGACSCLDTVGAPGQDIAGSGLAAGEVAMGTSGAPSPEAMVEMAPCPICHMPEQTCACLNAAPAPMAKDDEGDDMAMSEKCLDKGTGVQEQDLRQEATVPVKVDPESTSRVAKGAKEDRLKGMAELEAQVDAGTDPASVGLTPEQKKLPTVKKAVGVPMAKPPSGKSATAVPQSKPAAPTEKAEEEMEKGVLSGAIQGAKVGAAEGMVAAGAGVAPQHAVGSAIMGAVKHGIASAIAGAKAKAPVVTPPVVAAPAPAAPAAPAPVMKGADLSTPKGGALQAAHNAANPAPLHEAKAVMPTQAEHAARAQQFADHTPAVAPKQAPVAPRAAPVMNRPVAAPATSPVGRLKALMGLKS